MTYLPVGKIHTFEYVFILRQPGINYIKKANVHTGCVIQDDEVFQYL